MSPLVVLFAASVLGIDVGWQPLPEGGVEYIIQIPPQTFEVLKPGEPVQSRVPDEVKDIRQCRIIIGRGPLPRQLPPQAAAQSATPVFPHSVGKGFPGQPQAASPPNGSEETGASQLSEPTHSAGSTTSWWLMIGTLVALFASLGANVYLGWLTWELHHRCQTAAPPADETAGQSQKQS